jgi:hypothetical protein
MGLLPKHRTRAGYAIAKVASLAWPACILVAAAVGLEGLTPVHAQSANNGIIYSSRQTFRIPFETDGNERRLQEVQLWVSTDQGQTWRSGGAVGPDQRGFNFRADRDGLYWFVARTVDLQGQAHPATLQGAAPHLRVCVDTQLPVVTLRQGLAREGTWAVEWDIREENLDLSSFNLEYRPGNSQDWIPLSVEPAATGQRFWPADSGAPVEVRLKVRDLAKNEGEAKITLSQAGGGGQGSRLNYQDPGAARQSGRGPAVGTRWVNSKRVSLSYKLQEKGPSGVSLVELWFTRDTRTWDKYNDEKITEDQAGDDRTFTYVFEVQDEGKYGFTLVPRSGVNRSHPPPHSGDQPQIWVEVDTTKPVIEWLNVDVGRGPDTGTVTITWKATDKNLAREPITLSYSPNGQGGWTPIASNLENSGRYVWKMPSGVPYSFFVRIEATDLAKNVGSMDTPKPVLVDLHEPKGLILDANPADNK